MLASDRGQSINCRRWVCKPRDRGVNLGHQCADGAVTRRAVLLALIAAVQDEPHCEERANPMGHLLAAASGMVGVHSAAGREPFTPHAQLMPLYKQRQKAS